jgi:hypothetical protein
MSHTSADFIHHVDSHHEPSVSVSLGCGCPTDNPKDTVDHAFTRAIQDWFPNTPSGERPLLP